MTPSEIGERTEAAVLAALSSLGKAVLIPFGPRRYDLAFDEAGKLVRMQCKAGRQVAGAIHFRTHSVGRSALRDYRDDIDLFGVYCHEREEVYLVPVHDVPLRGARLRLEPPKNGQRAGIRAADKYLVMKGMPRLID